MLHAAIKRTGGVASNYSIMLFGVFFFPIQLIALFFARKRRLTAEEWEQTHYEMQYRTSVAYLFVQTVLFAFGLLLAYVTHGKGYPEIIRMQTGAIVLSTVGYLPLGWLLIRCVRGVYIAGSKSPLVRPSSYTIWPI
jgi:uncharacterized membrane protein